MPIRRHESIVLYEEPIHHILPNLFGELSLLEVLLTKRSRLESGVDLTNEDSQDALALALDALQGDIDRCVRATESFIKLVFPNSNTSVCSCTNFEYFLFQHDLSNLFPLSSKIFGAPTDPFCQQTDLQGHLRNMNMLQQMLGFCKMLLSSAPSDSLTPLLALLCQCLGTVGGEYEGLRLDLLPVLDQVLKSEGSLDSEWMAVYATFFLI